MENKTKELFDIVDEYLKNTETIINYYTLSVGRIVSILTQIGEKVPSFIPTQFMINLHDLIENNQIVSKFGYKTIKWWLELHDWHIMTAEWINYIGIKMVKDKSPTDKSFDYVGQIDFYYYYETQTITTKVPSLPYSYPDMYNGVYNKHPLIIITLSLFITVEDIVMSKIIENVKTDISPFTEFINNIINQYEFISGTVEITKMIR